MDDAFGEGSAEENRGRRLGVDVPEELEGVRVGSGVAAKDGAGLENHLVRAEVIAFKEGHLVLVGKVEGLLGVLLDTEMKCLDANSGVVCARVAGGEKLGAAKAGLIIEDGLVTRESVCKLNELGKKRAGSTLT